MSEPSPTTTTTPAAGLPLRDATTPTTPAPAETTTTTAPPSPSTTTTEPVISDLFKFTRPVADALLASAVNAVVGIVVATSGTYVGTASVDLAGRHALRARRDVGTRRRARMARPDGHVEGRHRSGQPRDPRVRRWARSPTPWVSSMWTCPSVSPRPCPTPSWWWRLTRTVTGGRRHRRQVPPGTGQRAVPSARACTCPGLVGQPRTGIRHVGSRPRPLHRGRGRTGDTADRSDGGRGRGPGRRPVPPGGAGGHRRRRPRPPGHHGAFADTGGPRPGLLSGTGRGGRGRGRSRRPPGGGRRRRRAPRQRRRLHRRGAGGGHGRKGAVHAVRLPLDVSLVFVVIVPDFSLSTSRARQVLPAEVRRESASFNLGRLALLIAGLADSRMLIGEATEDRLHQDYRSPLFPAAPKLLSRLSAGGALAVCWSGAGPSLLGIASGADGAAVQAAARDALPRRRSRGGAGPAAGPARPRGRPRGSGRQWDPLAVTGGGDDDVEPDAEDDGPVSTTSMPAAEADRRPACPPPPSASWSPSTIPIGARLRRAVRDARVHLRLPDDGPARLRHGQDRVRSRPRPSSS